MTNAIDTGGYLAYLERHRRFVLEAAQELGVEGRGLRHDLSKYEPDEFLAYAAYFYGGHERGHAPPEVQQAFDAAWLRHQHRNDHHWQFWVLREDTGAVKVLPMPEEAWREMVADWIGAGRAIPGGIADPVAWFLRHREHIMLHPDTMMAVDCALRELPDRGHR